MNRTFSLRTLLLVPLVLQLAATAVVISAVSTVGRQQEADALATRTQQRASRQLRDHLSSYLRTPQQVIRLMAAEVDSGRIDPSDERAVRRYLWTLRDTFPDAPYLNFGWSDGDFIGLGQVTNSNRQPFLEVAKARSIARLEQIRLDASGEPAGLERTKSFADFRGDGWYREPLQAGRPVWTPIYNWVDAPEVMAMGAGMPVRRNGRVIGVAGVDVFLANISRYLRDLPITASGEIYIVERDGTLVADSSDRLPFSIVNGRGVRHRAGDVAEPVIRETARALLQSSSGFGSLTQPRQLRLPVGQQNALVRVEPYRDGQGLDWRIVVVIPESDVYGNLRREAIERLVTSLLAILISGAIALLVVEFVIRRLERLVVGADAMADGNLRQVVEPGSIRELARLAASFNGLAARLQRSFSTLRARNREIQRLVTQRTEALAGSERRLQAEIRKREQLEQALATSRVMSSSELPADPLTGLLNRSGLEHQLAGSTGLRQSTGLPPVTLIQLAVGRPSGTVLSPFDPDPATLQRIASLLEDLAAAHHGLAARLGPGRFALLLRGVEKPALQELVAGLARRLQPLALWVGLAALEADAEATDWGRLLSRAEQALEEALAQPPVDPAGSIG